MGHGKIGIHLGAARRCGGHDEDAKAVSDFVRSKHERCRARGAGAWDLSPGNAGGGRGQQWACGSHALSLVDAVVVEAHEDTVVALNLP